MNIYIRAFLICAVLGLLSACSMAKMTVRISMPMVEGGMTALNKETDLILAESAMAPNIELLEGMLINDPENEVIRTYAAKAYYGYAYGFVEDENRQRASRFYYRGFLHGKQALNRYGLTEMHFNSSLDELQQAVNSLDENAISALFWTATCWSKWIDLNRSDPENIAQLPKAVMLMKQAHMLNPDYFMGGPTLFFAVYYGSRSPMLGGDFELSEKYFNQANAINNNKLLTVDLLRAQYLERQRFDQKKFHTLLTRIVETTDSLYPEQALINAISRRKAALLLEKEEQWF